jgi:hypothetical protein
MKKRILAGLMLVFALAGTNAFAANHFIRAGATGANNGTDWSNAWTSLNSVSWTRGDVYYIAAGSYGGVTLSTGASGTSTIEIRGAVGGSGDHGTATGWNDSFQGQAVISGSTINTNFWTINAQAVPGCVYPSDNPACHLIKFNNTSTGGQGLQLGSGSAVNNTTLKYIEVQGSNVHANSSDEGIQCTPGPCSNTYIGYTWIHNVGCDNLAFNENTDGTGFVLEYSWISYDNNGATPAAHCQGIMSTLAQMTLRYNVWQDMQSSGAITDAAGGNAPITEWDIYGNIFFWDAAWISQWSGNGAVGYDDGIVGIFSLTGNNGILKIYNNTFTSPGLASSQNCNAQAYTINAGMAFGTVIVENNIWYNFDSSKCNAGQAGPGTYDYNAYYNVSAGKQDNGAHSFASSTNPFVNPPASTVAGFALTKDTQTGVQLASPYNADMLGTTRGSSGVWDVGALQMSGTASSLPPVPQGIHVVSIQ